MADGSPFGERVEPVFPVAEPQQGSYRITFTVDGEERTTVCGGASRRDDAIAQLDEQGINYEVTEHN